MPELTPVMSLSAFLAALFIVSIAGRGVVELAELIEKRKARGIGSSNPAGKRRHLSPSQKAIQRYYRRKGA